ncbi:MAG: 16S rRNA (uracil(1498)-N(3))-methyltransferase [Sphingobacteriaceae bacterium]
MHIFYTPDIETSTYFLSEEESKHCIRVLRLKAHDPVQLVDGRGNLYLAEIADPHPKRTLLSVMEVKKEFHKRNHYLHLAVAPTKNIDRLEWLLEKATEIGVDEISWILCERSERKEVKNERLNKIVTAAVKQSIKAYHPKLNSVISFNSLMEGQTDAQKFIAHCEPGDKYSLKSQIQPKGNYLILIGPEGDFTPMEIRTALSNGFQSITLGEGRLRTETAALEACFEINFLNRL